ncbi:MAG: restriction endonuclease subunit S [Acidimicrobiales bacterium]
MTVTHVRVEDVLRLERRAVTVNPLETYQEIGVRSFGKGIFHKEPVGGAEIGTKRIFRIEPGDLVFSNVFAWEGAVALATDAEQGLVGSHRFMTYVPVDSDAVDVRYLRYLFTSEIGLAFLRKASPGSAGRNRTLAIDRFESIELPLPDLEEQRNVVRRLTDLDGQLDRANALGKTSSELARAIAPSLLNTGAGRRSVGELVQQARREESVDTSTEYRLLGVRWYGEGLFIREQKMGDEVAAAKLYRVKQGDFVYNRLFAWKGSFAVVQPGLDGCHVSGEFPTFEVDHANLDVRYLLALFTDPAIWGLVEDRSTGGTPTSRNRLKEAAFLNLEIPVPPLPEQVRIAGIVDMVRTTGLLRQHRGQYIDGLRASVLNQELAGLTQ